MDSEEEQNLHDQEWQQQAHKPGDVVRPTIDQEQFAKEVGYSPDPEDDENRIAPIEWDHENN